MYMKNYMVYASLFYCFMCAAACRAGEDDILGVWIDDKEEAKTEFVKNADGSFIAKLVWTIKADDGKELKDRKNPDRSLRDNPLIGTVVMKDVTYDSDKARWEMPWAYDPSWGMVGSGYIRLNDEGQLEVKGSKWGITVTRKLTKSSM